MSRLAEPLGFRCQRCGYPVRHGQPYRAITSPPDGRFEHITCKPLALGQRADFIPELTIQLRPPPPASA